MTDQDFDRCCRGLARAAKRLGRAWLSGEDADVVREEMEMMIDGTSGTNPILRFGRQRLHGIRMGTTTVFRCREEPPFSVGDEVEIAHLGRFHDGRTICYVRVLEVRRELRPGVWREGIGIDARDCRVNFPEEAALQGYDNWNHFMREYRQGNTDAQVQPSWRIRFEVSRRYCKRCKEFHPSAGGDDG